MLVERGSIKERINWKGILAGLVAGIGTQLALTALGVAIGAATIDSARGLAIGTILWLAVSLAISAFLAGLTAARAAGYLTPAQGGFNGLITGLLLTLLMTVFGFNALLGGVRTALGLAQGAANAAASAANTATQNGAGQSDPVQSLLNGLNEQELNQIIAEASPELDTEQVGAATNVVQGIVNRAVNDADLSNISRLDEFVPRRLDAITNALSGEQLVTRLERQGLSNAEAQETANSIRARAQELRTQAENTVQTVERVARSATSSAAWAFLLGSGLILLMSVLGGRRGHDVPPSGATVLPREGEDGTARQRA